MVERVKLRKPSDGDLDTPRYSYQDVARRYGVSHYAVRSWVQRSWLTKPTYLTTITARFSERQLREFEQAAPRNHQKAGR